MIRHLHFRVALAAFVAAITLQVGQSPPYAQTGGCSAGDPDIILCDDFKDETVFERWDIGSNPRSRPISQFVPCADGFGFNDRCAAWSSHLVFDSYWGFWGYDARRVFLPQSEFYVRWYQYISDPYTWGRLEDKSVMLHDPAHTITAYVATNRNQLPDTPNSGPGMPFVANYQDLDWGETGGRYTSVNRFQNQDRNITLQPGKWYLFEWYVKLGMPGVSDGETKLWIDDAAEPIVTQTLRMHYTDMRWLKSSDAGRRFGMLRLTVYHQRCDIHPDTCPPNGPAILAQSHRWDDIVISRTPIGPVGGSRPPSAPAAPGRTGGGGS